MSPSTCVTFCACDVFGSVSVAGPDYDVFKKDLNITYHGHAFVTTN